MRRRAARRRPYLELIDPTKSRIAKPNLGHELAFADSERCSCRCPQTAPKSHGNATPPTPSRAWDSGESSAHGTLARSTCTCYLCLLPVTLSVCLRRYLVTTVKQVNLRVSDDELSAYDEARGTVPRNAWMRAVLNGYLDSQNGQRGSVRPVQEPQGVQAVTPASEVGPPPMLRPETELRAHLPTCKCPVCKPPPVRA